MNQKKLRETRFKIISECRKAIAAEIKTERAKGNISLRGSLREELIINTIKKVCKMRGFKHYEHIVEIMDICEPKNK